MKDIARHCGTSVTTVSRVLADRPSTVPISETTRRRILAAAEELGYRPNAHARALRTLESNTIGAIITDVGSPFLSILLRKIDSAARNVGYHLLLVTAESNAAERDSFDSTLDEYLVDGVIILGEPSHQLELVSESIARRKPVVFVAREVESEGAYAVHVDNRKGTELALSYLMELGHRCIACIAGPDAADVQKRVQSYKEFVQYNDLPDLPGYIQTVKEDYEGGYRAAHHLLTGTDPPTAIFACADVMAIGAVYAAHELGMSVPDDLSVIGFDDIPVTRYTIPPVTTVHQPVDVMGEHTVQLMMDLLEDRGKVDRAAARVKLDPRLIVRGSCGPAGRAPVALRSAR
jgi:LacI family transcriptional regulator